MSKLSIVNDCAVKNVKINPPFSKLHPLEVKLRSIGETHNVAYHVDKDNDCHCILRFLTRAVFHYLHSTIHDVLFFKIVFSSSEGEE